MRENATVVESYGTIHEQLARALPTPVRRIELLPARRTSNRLESGAAGIWVKDDGRTAESYGGNKVRKLAPLLDAALRDGKRRIVTFGAAGSHHVLCTAVHARALGLATAAWLAPQPRTTHAERVLRCALGLGLQAMPVQGVRDALGFARRLTRDDYLIGPGGMGAIGASGYYEAAFELERQVECGALPAPDWIVLATGSGSTAAGLLAGLCATRLRTRLLGVLAAPNPAIRPIVLAQALAVARLQEASLGVAEASARIDFDATRLGAGYGHPVELDEAVAASAAVGGLTLDPTYTAKAFAAATTLAARAPSLSVLFWNTLSTTRLEPLLQRAPDFDELAPELRRLLRPIARSGSR
jgi:D-cysteine desulfhydrase